MRQILILVLFVGFINFGASDFRPRHHTGCTLSTGEIGECRLTSDCPGAKNQMEAQHCSYSRFAPVICCPLGRNEDKSKVVDTGKISSSSLDTTLRPPSLTVDKNQIKNDSAKLASRALFSPSKTPISTEKNPNSYDFNESIHKSLQPPLSSKNTGITSAHGSLSPPNSELLPPKIYINYPSPRLQPPIATFNSNPAYLPPSQSTNSDFTTLSKSLSPLTTDIFPPTNTLLPPARNVILPKSDESFPIKYVFLSNHFPLPIENTFSDQSWLPPPQSYYELVDTYPFYNY